VIVVVGEALIDIVAGDDGRREELVGGGPLNIAVGLSRLDEPALTIPHPRFRDRAFVLAPLAEIAPGMMDPETGLTVEALLRRLPPAARRS